MINEHEFTLPDNANVSRETEALLVQYVAMLVKWNAAINLVSHASIKEVWTRHIVDSIQVFNFGHTAKHWVDLGTGGGLPGLVVAILAQQLAPEMRITLVESDQRKAAFLRQASQMLGVRTHVIADRIEAVPPLGADIVSARALASLSVLCGFAKRHLARDGLAIFLKGKSAATEISEAQASWQFLLESHSSVTDPSATVLLVRNIVHV